VSAPGPGPGAALRRAGRWLSRVLLEPEYPLLAVEVRPCAVAAVRLALDRGRLGLGAAGVVDLPPATLDVSLTRPNLRDGEAFRTALRTVLERAGALGGGPVSLVLPDSAVRLALVPAEGLRGRGRDAVEVIRFRLHKALPFDVRTARLAWEPGSGEQALVAVAPDGVVREYEDALESLGFHAGLVEPASLSLASLAGPEPNGGDRLLVNWDVGYVSFLLLRDEQPLLVRTLPGEADAGTVARHATSTLQFYRDRLGGTSLRDAMVRAGACPAQQAIDTLAPVLGLPPRPVEPWARLGAALSDSVVQALAGAAASAVRRAA